MVRLSAHSLLTPGTPRAFPLLTLGSMYSFSSPPLWCGHLFHPPHLRALCFVSIEIFSYCLFHLSLDPSLSQAVVSLRVFQCFWVCPIVVRKKKPQKAPRFVCDPHWKLLWRKSQTQLRKMSRHRSLNGSLFPTTRICIQPKCLLPGRR